MVLTVLWNGKTAQRGGRIDLSRRKAIRTKRKPTRWPRNYRARKWRTGRALANTMENDKSGDLVASRTRVFCTTRR